MKNAWANLQAKQKIAVFCVGTVLFVAAFVYLIVLPQREEIETLSRTAGEARMKVEVIEEFMRRHPDLAAYDSEVESELALLEKKLPARVDISDFVAQMESACSTSRVTLLSVKPKDAFIPKTNYTEIELSIGVRGTYFQMMDLLKKLEALERFNRVRSMKVDASPNGVLTANFTLNLYSYGIIKKQEPKAEEKNASKS